jgi:DNA repair protein RadC
MGEARLAQLRGALELAGRLSREVLGDSPVLDTPERIAMLMKEDARAYSVEQFKVLLLNTRRRLIRVVNLASGTLDTILVHLATLPLFVSGIVTQVLMPRQAKGTFELQGT